MTLDDAMTVLRRHFKMVDFDHPQDRMRSEAPDGQKYKHVVAGPANCSDSDLIEAWLSHVLESDEFPSSVLYWRETPLILANDEDHLTLECRMVSGGPLRARYVAATLEQPSIRAVPWSDDNYRRAVR